MSVSIECSCEGCVRYCVGLRWHILAAGGTDRHYCPCGLLQVKSVADVVLQASLSVWVNRTKKAFGRDIEFAIGF